MCHTYILQKLKCSCRKTEEGKVVFGFFFFNLEKSYEKIVAKKKEKISQLLKQIKTLFILVVFSCSIGSM